MRRFHSGSPSNRIWRWRSSSPRMMRRTTNVAPGAAYNKRPRHECFAVMDEKDGEGYPRRGEIWFVETPNQPDDPHQPRPALIISANVRNRLADDVIVVPIFSRGR